MAGLKMVLDTLMAFLVLALLITYRDVVVVVHPDMLILMQTIAILFL
jgi:hypothetical protein|nr:MAG: hypothetical protein [Bacteriophage sp.]